MDTPNFLVNDKADVIEGGELSRLQSLVYDLLDEKATIEGMEETMAEHKEKARRIAQESIPTLLSQYGLSEIRLSDGIKVIVKEDASVSIKDGKQDEFFAFLKARGEEDIIKLMMQFARMPAEKLAQLFEFLNGYDYDYTAEKGVHPQTLKKYFKELLGIGEDPKDRENLVKMGKCLRRQDVESFANVFPFFNTTLKSK